jgi:hypothetical protein
VQPQQVPQAQLNMAVVQVENHLYLVTVGAPLAVELADMLGQEVAVLVRLMLVVFFLELVVQAEQVAVEAHTT